ncbi:MAG: hypothetical protein ACI8ZN_000224 [Bacteroidia bacterium]|jgi:hypothetical protein
MKTPKILSQIFLVSLVSLLSSSAYAGVYVTKSGGGVNGYNFVTETHKDGNHNLECSGEGKSACEWVIKPTVIGKSNLRYNLDFLIGLAEERIFEANIYEGTIIHNSEILIHWVGSPESYTIKISTAQ